MNVTNITHSYLIKFPRIYTNCYFSNFAFDSTKDKTTKN